MINLDKVMEHIDRIGVDEARRRIEQYDKEANGPTAEEFFGKDAIDALQKELNLK